jgi:hypothetical protein
MNRDVNVEQKRARDAQPPTTIGKSPTGIGGLDESQRFRDPGVFSMFEEPAEDLAVSSIVHTWLLVKLAKLDRILAIPTLLRKLPEPKKRVIGDLPNADRALLSLDFPKSQG